MPSLSYARPRCHFVFTSLLRIELIALEVANAFYVRFHIIRCEKIWWASEQFAGRNEFSPSKMRRKVEMKRNRLTRSVKIADDNKNRHGMHVSVVIHLFVWKYSVGIPSVGFIRSLFEYTLSNLQPNAISLYDFVRFNKVYTVHTQS